MKRFFYVALAGFLFVISFAQVSMASGVVSFQPRMPEELMKKECE